MKTTVRTARGADLPAMIELWKEMMDFHAERDGHFRRSPRGHLCWKRYAQAQIRSRKALVLVALRGGEVVGQLLAAVGRRPGVFAERDYGMINDIVVRPDARRAGVGTKLFLEAKRWLRRRGLRRVELSVATTNPASVPFWTGLGFRPTMERRVLDLR